MHVMMILSRSFGIASIKQSILCNRMGEGRAEVFVCVAERATIKHEPGSCASKNVVLRGEGDIFIER